MPVIDPTAPAKLSDASTLVTAVAAADRVVMLRPGQNVTSTVRQVADYVATTLPLAYVHTYRYRTQAEAAANYGGETLDQLDFNDLYFFARVVVEFWRDNPADTTEAYRRMDLLATYDPAADSAHQGYRTAGGRAAGDARIGLKLVKLTDPAATGVLAYSAQDATITAAGVPRYYDAGDGQGVLFYASTGPLPAPVPAPLGHPGGGWALITKPPVPGAGPTAPATSGGSGAPLPPVSFSNQLSLTITHNLGYTPVTQLYDSTGVGFDGPAQEVDLNTLRFDFANPTSGKVIFGGGGPGGLGAGAAYDDTAIKQRLGATTATDPALPVSRLPVSYAATGQQTDGYMTQKAVTDELNKRVNQAAVIAANGTVTLYPTSAAGVAALTSDSLLVLRGAQADNVNLSGVGTVDLAGASLALELAPLPYLGAQAGPSLVRGGYVNHRVGIYRQSVESSVRLEDLTGGESGFVQLLALKSAPQGTTSGPKTTATLARYRQRKTRFSGNEGGVFSFQQREDSAHAMDLHLVDCDISCTIGPIFSGLFHPDSRIYISRHDQAGFG